MQWHTLTTVETRPNFLCKTVAKLHAAMSHFLILSTPIREIVPLLSETYYYEILKNVVTLLLHLLFNHGIVLTIL